MAVGLDLNQTLTLKFRFSNPLISSLISIDNVPTLYQNKYSRVNYLPTQFRYLESGEYRYEANTNIF